ATQKSRERNKIAISNENRVNIQQSQEQQQTEAVVYINPSPAINTSELEQDLLRKFFEKIDKLKCILCSVYNKKNNMDLEEVPEKLQGLTEVEEMLISQVFTIMLVYQLHGGQYGYHGYIDSQLPQVQSEQNSDIDNDDMITRTFVPSLPSTYREDAAINNILNRLRNENSPIL
ncbi:9540_t:CDS:2, partial [Racocetra fulgida]